ncbi:ATP-binding protein [Sutcliffiella deserti]|uniref:ATP-binding protein n=1 Tax=Sutcliffiella deserti TaxID=2875501 RepID=UPI001CBF3963|nr:ATP-binding protein [Sutcliffiella deserti]
MVKRIDKNMLDEYMAKVRADCLEYRLDPNVIPVFTKIAPEELTRIQEEYADTLAIIRSFMDKFLGKSKGIPLLVAVTDHKANFIEYIGDASLQETVVNKIGLEKGVQFSGIKVGVNSILAALELQRPVQTIGTDHYFHFLHQTACYSVPLYLQDKIIGTISIMTFLDYAHPMIMASLETVVDSIERELNLLERNRYLNEMNQMILEKSNTGYVVIEKCGKIVKINPKAQSLLEEVKLDHYIQETVPFTAIHEKFKKGESIRDWKVGLSNSKGPIICLVDYFPFLEGSLIQLRDITEYKKTESYIQNAEKLSVVGELAAGVAHEIKNPLTILKGFIQLIQANRFNETYLAIMLKEIERIDQITNEFLVLSRPTVQEKSLYNIQKLFVEIEVLLSSFAIVKNIEIVHHYQDTPAIYCDGNQLKQVFINIVKNSVEAVDYNGKINIVIEPYNKKNILIRIMDNGNGFPEHILSKVGQPFLTTKENGNGLGIIICKRIVENIHKGELNIYNEENGGAVVDIILPQHTEIHIDE